MHPKFLQITSMGLILMAPFAYAATPATKEYVDQQAAILQATATSLQTQIDALSSIPAVAHPVGSYYGGGVVFYASTDANAPAGQRGLIAAPTDAMYSGNATMQWQQNVPTITVSTRRTYFVGEANTNNILSAPGGIFPAASAANTYTVAGDTCTACTPWYLPAQDELATLHAQSASSLALGDTTFWSACGASEPNLSYWSSTQGLVSSQALSVNFSNGLVTTSPSSSNLHVRAIRAF